MEDVDYFEQTLADLKALGVRLAIDDFGTGLLVAQLPQALPGRRRQGRPMRSSTGSGTDPHDSALVAAIVAMAGALDLDVTAEGVETQEQLAALRELRCARAQGFYLARPMPADAMTRLVTTSHRWNVD